MHCQLISVTAFRLRSQRAAELAKVSDKRSCKTKTTTEHEMRSEGTKEGALRFCSHCLRLHSFRGTWMGGMDASLAAGSTVWPLQPSRPTTPY